MVPTVKINGKSSPFLPLFHLRQLGLVDVIDTPEGIQKVMLIPEGLEETEKGKPIMETIRRLSTFRQLELVR